MLVEQRTYTVKAGMAPAYLRLYEAKGLEVQASYLGRPVGYYSSEIGALNQIIHMWAYQDMEDRRVRRERLFADPEWRSVVTEFYEMIVSMETKILLPAPFFAIDR